MQKPVFIFMTKKATYICFLVVYVDDLLLAASSHTFMDSVKATLSSTFRMKDLGEAKFILGVEIWQNCKSQTISLSQAQ
jgi:hypothetical protein